MSIYDIKVNNRKGEEVSLSDYKDKVLLIINTATRCGNTKQYTALEELFEKYHDKGFEILDFPCNQFGGQAPGTEEEIHDFCVLKYNTKFDQFQKIKVNGANASPLFVFLKEKIQQDEDIGPQNKRLKKAPKNPSDIRWNFTKFLVDKKGNVVGRFPPKCTPDFFEDKIKELLDITETSSDKTTEAKTKADTKKTTESAKKPTKAAEKTKVTKETKAAKETKTTKETKAKKETPKETTTTTPRRTSARIANRLAKEANKEEEKAENKSTTKTTKRKRAN